MVEIPLQIIGLENDNYHILIEGYFENETPSYWIIDTGASKSVLDSNLKQFYSYVESENEEDIQSAGITRGMMDTSVGEISFLQFGGLKITNQKVALIDLNHVNEIYSKYTPYRIAGLLGGDILMQYECVIDYSRKMIKFHIS